MIKVRVIGINPTEEVIETTLSVASKSYGDYGRRRCLLIAVIDTHSLRMMIRAYQAGYTLYEKHTMKRVILDD